MNYITAKKSKEISWGSQLLLHIITDLILQGEKYPNHSFLKGKHVYKRKKIDSK